LGRTLGENFWIFSYLPRARSRGAQGFQESGLPNWPFDFECRTIDHSDNSPSIFYVSPTPGKMQEKHARTA
jgi:hypothetical protein